MEIIKNNIDELIDGHTRLYDSNDLVRMNCDECKNCHSCCQYMGNSVILDPLDVHRLSTNLHKDFNELISDYVELNLVDGLIIPNIRMIGEEEKCVFLNTEGRCSIHKFRPGLCRMFPLGRYYQNGKLKYFVLSGGCPSRQTAKIKVKKWINTEDFNKYEYYVQIWHDYTKKIKEIINNETDEKNIRNINLYILNKFYNNPYLDKDFYDEFFQRIKQADIEI